MSDTREQWASKLGFILAAAGSAVGLGAIWKFPYVAGTSGGGAFLLLFLIFTLAIGLPILLAEFIIGRGSQKDAVSAYTFFAPNTKWNWIGKLGIATSFILLSFYSVVGGWILLYLAKTISGSLAGLSQPEYGHQFANLIADPYLAVVAQFIFLLITIFIVAKGVQKGIERASQIMMPALFISFIVLIVRSLTLDGIGEGLSFFLTPDFSKLDSKSILFALGQSFFALSVGVSVMVTYSSYLSRTQSLPRSAFMVAGMNVLVSLLAGLAIFPAVFAFGLEPAEGPGLLFVVLPAVFDKMPFGLFFLAIFLLLFLFAALTSAISMIEIIVAATAKNRQEKRVKHAWLAGMLIFLLGIPSALSFGILSDIHIFNRNIFDAADFLVSNILMPVGALSISVFAAWKIPASRLREEMASGSKVSRKLFALWYMLIKYVAPVAIFIVFLDAIGVFNKLK